MNGKQISLGQENMVIVTAAAGVCVDFRERKHAIGFGCLLAERLEERLLSYWDWSMNVVSEGPLRALPSCQNNTCSKNEGVTVAHFRQILFS